MTTLDDKIRPKVEDIIDRVGIAVTWTPAIQPGDYNEATGQATENGTPVTGVTMTPLLRYDKRLVDGDLIRENDSKAFFADRNLGFTPERGGQVTVGSDEWRVVNLRDIRSGDQTAAWELQLRRG